MSVLVFRHDIVVPAATSIRSTAQLMPDPLANHTSDSGSIGVDDAIRAAVTALGDIMFGCATEMFRIGQGALNAADTYTSVDAAF